VQEKMAQYAHRILLSPSLPAYSNEEVKNTLLVHVHDSQSSRSNFHYTDRAMLKNTDGDCRMALSEGMTQDGLLLSKKLAVH
jgi:hypothetical protein